MNSSLTNLNPPEFDDVDDYEERQIVPSIKVLVFSIGSIKLGVRIEYVYKVLNDAQIYMSGFNWIGIAHLGDREVTVLDLQQRLFPDNSNPQNFEGGYLIVIQNPESGELYGIPVKDAPVLMDVPLPSFRVLPASFRNSDILGIASHVAVFSEAEISLTLFLLDVNIVTAV